MITSPPTSTILEWIHVAHKSNLRILSIPGGLMDWFGTIRRFGSRAITGVIHVGANDGCEHQMYVKNDISRQVWIEPHPVPYAKLVAALPKNKDIKTFQVACGSTSGRAKMIILRGNNHESNSLLKPKKHLDYFPEFPVSGECDVDVIRLDELVLNNGIVPTAHNLLVLDVQGYELECLKGAEQIIDAIDYIISEVNAEELYEGCALIGDLDAWLLAHGFKRVDCEWRDASRSFGDAIYVAHRALKSC